MSILNQIDTPYLLLEKEKFLSNIKRVQKIISDQNGILRLHLKTIKSLDAANYLLSSKNSPVTVSNLREAEVFADAGYKDIIYAVGISENKLPRVLALRKRNVDIAILLDSVEQAKSVSYFCKMKKCHIPVYIEIDCDGHRAGINPQDPELIIISNIIGQSPATIEGVLVHAGESYNCSTENELVQCADNERKVALTAANILRDNGFECPKVSIGSTPTALYHSNLEGITDVRAGVFPFFDLVMAGIGACNVENIALSVVTTVIGLNREKNLIFIDAGWMALSRDRGTQEQAVDCGYGLVCNRHGELISNLKVKSVNQEHGIIEALDEESIQHIKIGMPLRILPNHACSTAAMHSGYHVQSNHNSNLEFWPRIQGW